MNHKDLDVWKQGIDFVADIYSFSKGFPKEEVYGLTSQIRRASVSIPSNIAEGAARNSQKEFIQFLHIALGSAAEVETQLILAEKLAFTASAKEQLERVERIKQMLSGLIRHCQARRKTGRP